MQWWCSAQLIVHLDGRVEYSGAPDAPAEEEAAPPVDDDPKTHFAFFDPEREVTFNSRGTAPPAAERTVVKPPPPPPAEELFDDHTEITPPELLSDVTESLITPRRACAPRCH